MGSVLRILGQGTFGAVYQARVKETGDIVAIKVIKNPPAKDREVQILKELRGHPNIISLEGAFFSKDPESKESRLHLAMEYISDTMHRVLKHTAKDGKNLETARVRLYQYQLLRGLAYMHGSGIMHCDIKPQNIFIQGKTHTLKIGDFGTAKRRFLGEQGLVAYACSRYYRAPEMILGSTTYSTAVDLWSAGCIFVEMIILQPLFTGTDGINQLVQIVKVIGTPTSQELRQMNPNYPEYRFTPEVQALPWDRVFKNLAPREASEVAGGLLRYDPSSRTPPLFALMLHFFDPIRYEDKPEHRPLLEFAPEELWWCTQKDREKLIPRWVRAQHSNGRGGGNAFPQSPGSV